jgi:hypothetical protein
MKCNASNEVRGGGTNLPSHVLLVVVLLVSQFATGVSTVAYLCWVFTHVLTRLPCCWPHLREMLIQVTSRPTSIVHLVSARGAVGSRSTGWVSLPHLAVDSRTHVRISSSMTVGWVHSDAWKSAGLCSRSSSSARLGNNGWALFLSIWRSARWVDSALRHIALLYFREDT